MSSPGLRDGHLPRRVRAGTPLPARLQHLPDLADQIMNADIGQRPWEPLSADPAVWSVDAVDSPSTVI
jgi:hypothetical protein